MPDSETGSSPVRDAEAHPPNSGTHDTDRTVDLQRESVRERFGAFSLVYIGIFLLLFAYLTTVRLMEAVLDHHFQTRIQQAILVDRFDQSVRHQIKEGVESVVQDSAWVRPGGVEVRTVVLARDEATWLYVDGHGGATTQSTEGQPTAAGHFEEWLRYLPASADVKVTLPHNSLVSNGVLIAYSSLLLLVISISNRRLIDRETGRLGDALGSRNQAARRAAEIEEELSQTRSRLSQVEPLGREQSEEIDALERERHGLRRQLEVLASREEVLRGEARQAVELSQEVRALEDLLDEATGDLDVKDEAIDRLEQNLKQVTRSTGKTRTKMSESLSRRFRTLYKTIEIDERALDNLADLGDESLRLKAEESIKRLAEDAENVSVRRKVGGLPSHLTVFELGFAGKGRIYYTKGKARRFRILLVGAKNTQSGDLDFLGRMPKEEFQ